MQELSHSNCRRSCSCNRSSALTIIILKSNYHLRTPTWVNNVQSHRQICSLNDMHIKSSILRINICQNVLFRKDLGGHLKHICQIWPMGQVLWVTVLTFNMDLGMLQGRKSTANTQNYVFNTCWIVDASYIFLLISVFFYTVLLKINANKRNKAL